MMVAISLTISNNCVSVSHDLLRVESTLERIYDIRIIAEEYLYIEEAHMDIIMLLMIRLVCNRRH